VTKAETDLAKAIVKNHYVELTSKAKLEAAERLAESGHVKIYDNDGKTWAKARGRASYDRLAELAKG
jgi:hypothetical protein